MYPKDERYAFSEKWSQEIAEFNFTQVPNILLACQGHLYLTDGEVLTLNHLLTFQFSSESRIYPTITTLTKFSHKGYSTVQKRLSELERKGYINRKHRLGTSNYYDLSPCVEQLTRHARTCNRTGIKRVDYSETMRSLPSSITSNKEDETLNIQTKENINNSGKVIIAGIPIDAASLSWLDK